MKHSILKDKKVVEAELLEWAAFVENPDNKVVKQEQVGDFWVSTVFLGINYAMSEDHPGLWFETMVFNKPAGSKKLEDWGEQYMDRYSTYEEAEKGHKKAVEWAKEKK